MLFQKSLTNASKNFAKFLTAAICTATVSVAALASAPISAEAAASVSGTDIVRTAVTYLGVPYVSGGASRSGADCSGFVYSVLTELGFGNVPRASASWGSGSFALTYNGQAVQVQAVDPSASQAGDILVYNGHVGFSMGTMPYADMKNYVASLGGNSNLVFEDYSPWPARSPWYRIHARSAAPNAEGRIRGIEIDNTNTGSTSSSYATVAYRIAGLETPSAQPTVSQPVEQPTASQPVEQPAVSQPVEQPTASQPVVNQVAPSSNGYTVSGNAGNKSVFKVLAATWTRESNQGDLVWTEVPVNADGSFSLNISAPKSGEAYITHVHALTFDGRDSIIAMQEFAS